METLLAIFLSQMGIAIGLECYVCSDLEFDGIPNDDGDCFNVGADIKSGGSAKVESCTTIFHFQGGLVTGVERGHSEGTIPGDKCLTELNPDNVLSVKTTCHYYCNTDQCNNLGISSLKRCNSDCGQEEDRGRCDYLSGICICEDGYTGYNCGQTPPADAPVKRKCIQCSSEEDGCKSQTVGSNCPEDEQYCFAMHSSVFTISGSVRTSIIRGCSNVFVAVDKCKITDLPDNDAFEGRGYKEITCTSTCDYDNCNVDIPDGHINGGEKKTLQCVQCKSSDGGCTEERTNCPAGTNYCKATVTYVISDENDNNYQATKPSSFKFLSEVRECSNESVTTQCTEVKVNYGPTFKQVTCQETCQEDGCNIGWPARPKCIQCRGMPGGEDNCIRNPTPAQRCPWPYEKYCYITDRGLDKSTRGTLDGFPREVERDCSYIDRGSKCTTSTLRGKHIQVCNYTCTSDGCNVGSRATVHSTPSLSVFLFVFSAVILLGKY